MVYLPCGWDNYEVLSRNLVCSTYKYSVHCRLQNYISWSNEPVIIIMIRSTTFLGLTSQLIIMIRSTEANAKQRSDATLAS